MDTYSFSESFILATCRLSPLFFGGTISPLSKVPGLVRTIILLIFAFIISINLGSQQVSQPIGLAIMAELFIGLTAALVVFATFTAIQFWGKVVDMQMGFGAAGIMDPGSKSMESLMGSIITLGLTTFFFLTGGHVFLLQILVKSFDVMPMGSFSIWLSASQMAKFWATTLLVAMMIMAPVLVMLWCIDWMVGMVSKTMPQVNIYFVTLPLKMAIGMGIFVVTLPHAQVVFEQLMTNMFGQLT